MVTETMQAWQVDNGDSLDIGGETFYVAYVRDEDEAITFFGQWPDEGITNVEISRHPYDEVRVIVSWEDPE